MLTPILLGLYYLGLVVVGTGSVYLWVLALASIRLPALPRPGGQRTRFAILVPAHDEEATIAPMASALTRLDYPRDLYCTYVVADHCGDGTARAARSAGAVVFERSSGPRGSKGAALAWLLDHVLEVEPQLDAVVVFDADTQVDPGFLAAMDARLAQGVDAIQGRHCISNAADGTYPALADAMMRIDNRLGNQGRVNLGLSAKHMGDSICFRTDVVRRYWNQFGLTEDYSLRQRLLLEDIRIDYAREAVGFGEAPASWMVARTQRARWLSGTFGSSRANAASMLRQGLRPRNPALIDGALQAILPSYSTLVLLTALGIGGTALGLGGLRSVLLLPWLALLLALGAYPFFGLLVDRAPRTTFVALLTGPVFIVWRTGLALLTRAPGHDVVWQRTQRRSS